MARPGSLGTLFPGTPFGFMGCHDYARGGELTNWGVHLMDIVHWGIRQDRPLSVQALGGSYRGSAGAENYENVDVLWEYPGCTVTWEQRHQNEYRGHTYGIKFQGTEGQLLVDRNTFDVLPESLGIPRYVGEPERSWAHPPHHNNFFESMRTRKPPAAEIEQGHRSTDAAPAGGDRAEDQAQALLGRRDRDIPERRGRQSVPDPVLSSTLAPLSGGEFLCVRLVECSSHSFAAGRGRPGQRLAEIDQLIAGLTGDDEQARSLARQLLPRHAKSRPCRGCFPFWVRRRPRSARPRSACLPISPTRSRPRARRPIVPR